MAFNNKKVTRAVKSVFKKIKDDIPRFAGDLRGLGDLIKMAPRLRRERMKKKKANNKKKK